MIDNCIDCKVGVRPVSYYYEQALVCLSNRYIVDASRARTFQCNMANHRSISVFSLFGVA